MNPGRFQRVKEILLRVVDLPELERKAILDQACADDPELRTDIEGLLVHDFPGTGGPGEDLLLRRLEMLKFLSGSSRSSADAAHPVSQSDATVMSTPADWFAPGQVLGNRYRIMKLLGRGGMGEVYRADDLDLGVPVALKTIRPEIASDPAVLRRFKQEVLLARSVTHPNVCRIYDLGRHHDAARDVTFLTMEFLPGETLSARIQSRGRLSRAEASLIARQLADALDAAHQAGIVHRDFKSANVMLVPTEKGERAVITDFGLAMGAEEADVPAQAERSSGTWISGGPIFLGTPAYMSPEQVRGERAGPAADLYAFGVVLFEMATGSVPFSGRTPLETALLRLGSPPPSLSALVDVDAEWEAAIQRLLSLEPGGRFTNGADAVAALEGREAAPASGAVSKSSHRAAFRLPAERDAFVGRTRKLAELADRLEGGRSQVTVLGVGGTGKTRLARRYGWTSLDRWSGGVWFCDLSEARTADGIVHAVAAGLDVPLGKDDPIAQLGHVIAGRGRALIILDNFEQVREHTEATLGQWVALARDASFLVTSRERLQLEGEAVLDLDPLDPETEGIELFAERARAQVAGFALDSNRAMVRDIVRSVDGLPLAIELAAARLRALSLEQLRARLVDRLGLLVGPKRGRQGTLRATLDWSWELLEPWEQAAVAQASVFEGGFTLEAAEAVLEVTNWSEAPAVLDVVQALVDKSWLRARSVLGAPRFEMYATVREYASEKLRGAAVGAGGATGTEVEADLAAEPMSHPGVPCEEVERRHGVYYAAMGTEEAVEALDRHGGVAKRAALHLEIDNLVAACKRAVERADPETATGALAASWEVLSLTGPMAVAVDLGQLVTGMPEIQPVQRARAVRRLGLALRAVGRGEESRCCYEEALAIHRELGDRKSEGWILCNLSLLLAGQGSVKEALRFGEDALAVYRDVGDRPSEGIVLGGLGIAHILQGHVTEAERHFDEALAIFREVGNRRYQGVTLANLGNMYDAQGRMEEARRCCEEALVIHREVGSRRFEGATHGVLACIHRKQGRPEDARRCYEEGLAIDREVGDRTFEGSKHSGLGLLEAEQGHIEEALHHYGKALAILREVGARRSEGSVLANLGTLWMGQGRMEEALHHYLEALAIQREVGDRHFEGVTLGKLGRLHARQGRPEEALRLYQEALTIHREVGDHPSAGIVLSNLADLHTKQGRMEEARRCLEEGIPELRAVGNRMDLAMTLCILGECERQQANLPAAHAALAEAETIAESQAATPDSELAGKIAELRQALTIEEP